ncbi:hypothetical protein NO1_1349, partial [Candidatus Termititenax aidoneus]
AVATALGGKEDSSNKATSITDVNKNEAVKYPTIGAVTAWAGSKEDSANKVTAITAGNIEDATKYPTTGAVAALVNTKEDSANKVTAITAASIEDTAKYPTVGAVTAWATTELMNILLPAGTILAMSTSSWNTASATFKSKWSVCDSTNGTPDLRGKFLRGGTSTDAAYYDNPTTTNTQTISVPLPQHNHPASSSLRLWGDDEGSKSGTYTTETSLGFDCDSGGVYDRACKKFTDNLVTTSITNTGTAGASITVNTMPSYYTVIYIMKVA